MSLKCCLDKPYIKFKIIRILVFLTITYADLCFVLFFFKQEPNNPLVSTFHVLEVVLRVLPMSFCLVLTNKEICGSVRLNNMPGKYWVNWDFKLFQWILQTFCIGLREQIIKISGIWLAYQKQKLLKIKH